MRDHLVTYFSICLFLTAKHGMSYNISQTTGIQYYNLFSMTDYTAMQNEQNYIPKHCSMQASVEFENNLTNVTLHFPLCENILVAVVFNLSVEIQFDENGEKSLICENLSPDNYRVYHLWDKQDTCTYPTRSSNGSTTHHLNNTVLQAYCETKFANVTENLSTRAYSIDYSELLEKEVHHYFTDNDTHFIAHISKFGEYKLINDKVFVKEYHSHYVNENWNTVTYNCTDTSTSTTQASTTTENYNVANIVPLDNSLIISILLFYLYKQFML